MVELRFFGMLAAALTLSVFAPSAYASVVYDFTFVNSENGGGTVDGTVTLPSSANGAYAASSVMVTSNTAGFGVGEYVGFTQDITDNTFVISGGEITNASMFLILEKQIWHRGLLNAVLWILTPSRRSWPADCPTWAAT